MTKQECEHGKEIGKTCMGCGGLCLAGCHCESSNLDPKCPVHFSQEKKHVCCNGECNHDDCCGKVSENCPLNNRGMDVNYLQVGRTVKCGHCAPNFEWIPIETCPCVCHDRKCPECPFMDNVHSPTCPKRMIDIKVTNTNEKPCQCMTCQGKRHAEGQPDLIGHIGKQVSKSMKPIKENLDERADYEKWFDEQIAEAKKKGYEEGLGSRDDAISLGMAMAKEEMKGENFRKGYTKGYDEGAGDVESWKKQIDEAYQKGLHESAIKVDKEMMAFLKDHNESGDFLKKLLDEILHTERKDIVEKINAVIKNKEQVNGFQPYHKCSDNCGEPCWLAGNERKIFFDGFDDGRNMMKIDLLDLINIIQKK